MNPFDVFIDSRWVNRVFDSETDPAEVKRSLINHDGYYSGIIVKRGGKYIPKGRCWTEQALQLGRK